ncbi:DUF1611 domain-containing protein [Microbacterium capsulatum]|uniref:DUF1611 domain-containing protein n=1 Tax=Microbacterium capsulatum TaxID=3041921 RepID=A0ABU0XIP1_9MICO|nr:DUF1611 domain-containing protein [Microbacterium sp. ASV81]MDQ4215007.1 DUF1611 domain-containing protein [Microbacterium sp. ASV81]
MPLTSLPTPTADSDAASFAHPAGAHEEISAQRLRAAKPAYTTRFLAQELARDADGYTLVRGDAVAPRPGDIVLAAVTKIGHHTGIELPGGRKSLLHVGDEVLVAYGNRYAPDQFEAEVPADLGPAHLVAAGGIASRALSRHSAIKEATQLRPVGLLARAGAVLRLGDFAPLTIDVGAPTPVTPRRPAVVAVLGTSMNSGKTTSAAALVRGISAAGYRVAACKATGTGAGGDPGQFTDSGAARVLDFTDFGCPSTYLLDHGTVRDLFASMLAAAGAPLPTGDPIDVVVVEIADGLFQRETAALVADAVFARHVHHVVFASGDAMGAVGGVARLEAAGRTAALLTGRMTMSPLATAEARAALSLPVLTVQEIATAEVVRHLPALADVRVAS